MNVGHLARDADLVVVEIAEVLFAVFGVIKDLRQRFVAVLVGVDIGVVSFVGCTPEVIAFRPRRSGCVSGSVLVQASLSWRSFRKAASERVVGVCPDLGIAGGLFDFGADELVFKSYW